MPDDPIAKIAWDENPSAEDMERFTLHINGLDDESVVRLAGSLVEIIVRQSVEAGITSAGEQIEKSWER